MTLFKDNVIYDKIRTPQTQKSKEGMLDKSVCIDLTSVV